MQTNASVLRKEFVKYLVPSVASLLSLSLYILADTYFVSRGVGSTGLAALNIAIPAYSVINATGLMLGIGAGVVYSVSRGAGDNKKANRSYNTVVWIALLTGVLFTLIGTVFAEPMALLLGASELSLSYAATYIRTLFSFSVFFVLNTTLGALVRNDGNPRLSMVSMVANSFSNVMLDYLFVIRFGWGMWGAAFATGLSPMIGLGILSLHWIKRRNGFHLERRLPDFRLTGSILRGGVSNFIIEVGNGLIIVLFNFTLMGLAGDVAVAAYGIVANISLVVSYIFAGVGQGMQPLVSTRYGAGRLDDCRRVLRMAVIVSVVIGAFFTATGFLLPTQLTAVFNSENNRQLAEITVPAIRIYFSCFLFMAVNICCAAYYQSTMKATVASVISLMRGYVLVVAGVTVLPRLCGINGVWMITPIAELVTTLLCIALAIAPCMSYKNQMKKGCPNACNH